MRNLILKIFSQMNYSLANQEEVLEPIMYRQPHIEHRSLPVKPVIETSLENSNKELVTTLDLRFAIDYRNYTNRFTPLQKMATVNRYKKKQNSTEKYVAAIHEPQVVTLPQPGCIDKGFKLEIFEEKSPNASTDENERTLEVFSFNATRRLPAHIISSSEDISNDFLEYMLGDGRSCSNYAFQFFVNITFIENNKAHEQHTITISSNVFEYGPLDHPSYVYVFGVDNEHYHLGNTTHADNVVSPGTFSKFYSSIKKKFRLKKSNNSPK